MISCASQHLEIAKVAPAGIALMMENMEKTLAEIDS